MKDRLRIIDGQIEKFKLIDELSEFPLQILDIIMEQLNNTKYLDLSYIDLDTIFGIISMRMSNIGMIFFSLRHIYTESCIYCKSLFEEWKVSHLLSSMVNMFYMRDFIEDLFTNNDCVEVITYVDKNSRENYNSSIIIKSNDSIVSFENRGIRYTEDIHLIDIKDVSVVVDTQKDGNFSSIYRVVLLIMDNQDMIYDISLPLMDYKCLIEKTLPEEEDYDNTKVESISIFRSSDYASIIE